MNLLKRLFGKRKTVLVIEDDPQTATLLTRFLKLRGYDATSAEDGVRGIDLIERDLPDLVLLDIMLPRISGFDVLLKVKSQPKTKAVPVVVCSALNGIGDIERCCKWGAEGYITKPFDLDRVSEKIESILSAGSMEKPASEEKN